MRSYMGSPQSGKAGTMPQLQESVLGSPQTESVIQREEGKAGLTSGLSFHTFVSYICNLTFVFSFFSSLYIYIGTYV